MSWLLFVLVWLAVSLSACFVWVAEELRRERAAHADTKRKLMGATPIRLGGGT